MAPKLGSASGNILLGGGIGAGSAAPGLDCSRSLVVPHAPYGPDQEAMLLDKRQCRNGSQKHSDSARVDVGRTTIGTKLAGLDQGAAATEANRGALNSRGPQ